MAASEMADGSHSHWYCRVKCFPTHLKLLCQAATYWGQARVENTHVPPDSQVETQAAEQVWLHSCPHLFHSISAPTNPNSPTFSRETAAYEVNIQ